MRTLRQRSGNVGFDPTHLSSAPRQPDHHLHDRTPWRTRPFQTSRVFLPLPWGEGWGEGEGISLSFTALFSAAGSGLNSIENSEEPTEIVLAHTVPALSANLLHQNAHECSCHSLWFSFHSSSNSRKRRTGGESSSSCQTNTSGTRCTGFSKTKCRTGAGVTTDSVTTPIPAPAST